MGKIKIKIRNNKYNGSGILGETSFHHIVSDDCLLYFNNYFYVTKFIIKMRFVKILYYYILYD